MRRVGMPSEYVSRAAKTLIALSVASVTVVQPSFFAGQVYRDTNALSSCFGAEFAYAGTPVLDPTHLEDGVYSVQVELNKLSAVDEGTMPAAFLDEGAVIYAVDGKLWIEVLLREANIMGSAYNADGLQFYDNESFSLNGSALALSEGAKASSTVLSFERNPTNKYAHWPRRVLGELPLQARINGGYTAVAMGSSTMSSSGLCLKVKWDQLAARDGATPVVPQPEPADKAVLEGKLAQYMQLADANPEDAAFAQVVAEAKEAQKTFENPKASQMQVDTMAQSLNAVMQGYMKAGLKAALDNANQIYPGKYTAATRAPFVAARQQASAVLANDEATREEIDAASAKLADAMGSLVESEIDKSGLYALVEEAGGVSQGAATDRVFASLQTTVNKAQAACDNDAATQAAVNDAQSKLANALNACAKSDLEEQLKAAKAIDVSSYTESSVENLNTKIKKGDTTLGSSKSKRKDMWAAADGIRSAIGTLETRPQATQAETNVRIVPVQYTNANGAENMASSYMEPTARVTALADGSYAVDIAPLASSAEYGIVGYRTQEEKADEVLDGGVTRFRYFADTLQRPLPAYLEVGAMGGARMPVYLVVDSDDFAYAGNDAGSESGGKGTSDGKQHNASEGNAAADGQGADEGAEKTDDDAAGRVAQREAASNINTATVSAAQVKKASDLGATTVTLGAKVKRIAPNAFRGTKVKTLVVKTTKLNAKKVKGSLKGSAVTTVKVQVKNLKPTKGLKGKKLKAAKKANKKAKATNKKYVKKYKKIFTKKVCGKKSQVK